MRRLLTGLMGAGLGLLAAGPTVGQMPPPDARLDPGLPPILRAAAIEQRLDALVPGDAVLRDETGREIHFDDLLGRRPILLIPAYFTCPMLCSQVLAGTARVLSVLQLEMGSDYDVVTVSFDARDTPEAARAARAAYLPRAGAAAREAGWRFLTGDEAQVRRITDAIGFGFRFEPEQNQFAHASAIVLLTPEGRVSKYFFGIEYSARDLRLGLVEASANRIGTPVDQLLLYCYRYDPATGRYGAVVMNMLRVAAVFTVIGLVAMIALLRPAWQKAQQARAGGAR